MAIVMISSLSTESRVELASQLADKTGWPVLTREALVDRAREFGIRIGRLETSIIKKPVSQERLNREKNLYVAFLTAAIADAAGSGDLIYCGRAGHLLLPNVGHTLRVGLTVPRETRVQQAVNALNLPADKAARYVDQLDQDIERWVRFIHRVDPGTPGQFDLVLSLEHIGMSNVAGILCETASLTDFRQTPLSLRRLADHRLAAHAKLRLANDPRTEAADLQVLADDGVLTITYPPRQEGLATAIPDVLSTLDGCRRIQCTMAESSILWVQERFEPDSESLARITSLAQRWGAAIELLRLLPTDDDGAEPESAAPAARARRCLPARQLLNNGGVEDDEAPASVDDGGLDRVQEELVGLGQSGGQRTVGGGTAGMLKSLEDQGRYSLVVVGDVFLGKGEAARTRLTRELALAMRDRLKTPVITGDELKTRFSFGRRQAVRLVALAALVAIAYLAVFSHQTQILDFLGGSLHERQPWLAPLAVVLFVPLLAWAYGTVSALTLQLLKID